MRIYVRTSSRTAVSFGIWPFPLLYLLFLWPLFVLFAVRWLFTTEALTPEAKAVVVGSCLALCVWAFS